MSHQAKQVHEDMMTSLVEGLLNFKVSNPELCVFQECPCSYPQQQMTKASACWVLTLLETDVKVI